MGEILLKQWPDKTIHTLSMRSEKSHRKLCSHCWKRSPRRLDRAGGYLRWRNCDVTDVTDSRCQNQTDLAELSGWRRRYWKAVQDRVVATIFLGNVALRRRSNDIAVRRDTAPTKFACLVLVELPLVLFSCHRITSLP